MGVENLAERLLEWTVVVLYCREVGIVERGRMVDSVWTVADDCELAVSCKVVCAVEMYFILS